MSDWKNVPVKKNWVKLDDGTPGMKGTPGLYLCRYGDKFCWTGFDGVEHAREFMNRLNDQKNNLWFILDVL